jgi:hypothetical protein
MTYDLATINPFYAARTSRTAIVQTAEPAGPVYARLPRAPKTASPVPHLTSLYHFHRAGMYGDRQWPGNCGGNLIKDLLLYFRPGLVFDPLCGAPHNGSCVAQCVMWCRVLSCEEFRANARLNAT